GWSVHLVRTAQTVGWTHDAVKEVLGQFDFAQSILAPTHWVTQGVTAARKGDIAQASYRLALVLSNGLFAYVVTAWLASVLYRPGFNHLTTGGPSQRTRTLKDRLLGLVGAGTSSPSATPVQGPALVDRIVSGGLAFLDNQTRVLMMKDFRTFRRDPAQWAQVA